jgi:catechol 2,3-dioxygenase-like lactoylglutathione lyase family enzyme
MPTGIDHIVIAVRDLDAASRDFAEAGFTVVPGGKHKTGLSHNALIAMQDGTYFEIIAFLDPDNPDSGPWSETLRESGEGLVDFALRTDDLDREVESLRMNGLEPIGPTPGGRVRPDGQRIDWRTIRFEDASLPFYCHDETPRELRVPGGEEAVHANGVTGVASISIPVSDVVEAGLVYRQLTGLDGNDVGEAKRFAAGTQAIDLVQGEGSRPVEVVLVSPTGTGEPIPEHLTHGARLIVSDVA